MQTAFGREIQTEDQEFIKRKSFLTRK